MAKKRSKRKPTREAPHSPAGKDTTAARNRKWMTLGMLAVGMAVLVLAIYFATRPAEPPRGSSSAQTPAASNQPSLAEQVKANAARWVQMNKPDQAVRVMREYLRTSPDDVEIRPLLAETLLRMDQTDAAADVVNDLLDRAPRLPDAWWLKGEIARRRGQADYMEDFRRAADSPDGAPPEILARYGLVLLSRQQPDAAEPYLRRAVDAGFRNAPTLEAMGRIALRHNDLPAAQKYLEESLQYGGDDAAVLIILADIRKNRGDLDGASRALQRALGARKGDEQRPFALVELAKLQLAEGNFPAAAKTFAEASDYPAVRGQAALQAAQAYYFAEQYALAMHYVDRAAQAEPRLPGLNAWMAKIENARFGDPVAPSRPSLPNIPNDAASPAGNAQGQAGQTDLSLPTTIQLP